MPDRTRNLVATFLLVISLLVVVLLSGCGSPPPCAARCTPRGLWESPTYQATRALLLVSNPALGIRRVNGRNGQPPCLGRDGVREYYVSPGSHTITAAFRERVPDDGVLGEVKGGLVTVAHNFRVGHAYVAFYRVHPYPKPEGRPVGNVATNARQSDQRYYWTLEIVDLDEAPPPVEPEVREARLYTARIKGAAALSD